MQAIRSGSINATSPTYEIEHDNQSLTHIQQMAIGNKDKSIETLRGIAIIFMVAGHVIGPLDRVGLQVADDSYWRYFHYSFQYLRMPLFTVISGYVYALHPVARDHIQKFAKGKARRILLPFLTVSTLQYVITAVAPTNESHELANFYTIYVFRYAQFWFLQAIALVFLTVGVLEYYGMLGNLRNIATFNVVALAISIAVGISHLNLNFFSLGEFFYLLPFFVFGVIINRYGKLLRRNDIRAAVSVLFLICISFQQYYWFTGIRPGKQSLLGIMTGLSGIYMIFCLRKSNTILGWLGSYSYGIFLFHMFGTAGSRIIASSMGIQSKPLLFVLGLSFGLLFPIVLEKRVLIKTKIPRRILLGLR